ncbi:MAG: lamin tail domain-containing protein [Planctomycetales bacterium]|nr:lamin tail domain-containing protein [Planctomycetales bacterium]
MNVHCRKQRRRWSVEPLEARIVLDSTVVFNEIMYHPESGQDGAEWIELHNQMSVDMDLSDWTIDGGVSYQFPPDTKLAGGAYLVVARDPDAIQVANRNIVFGPFDGRLSNGGERLRLLNRSERTMDQIEYSDRGDWPAGADGTGASLAKAEALAGSEDASNWTISARAGGTPGRANFVEFDPTPSRYLLISEATTWSHTADPQTSGDWTTTEFDDADWDSGEPIFYRGEFTSIPSPNDSSGLEAIEPILIQNPSFEANTNFGVGYGVISGWTIAGASGINPSRSGSTAFLDNGTVEDGSQVAFLQTTGASVSQQLSGFTPGQEYELQLHYNARSCCNIRPDLKVSIGSQTLIEIGNVAPAGDADFHIATTRFLALSGSAELVIENAGDAGDHTLLLDSVSIQPTNSEHLTVLNSSFEASGPRSAVAAGDATIAGWNTSGSDIATVETVAGAEVPNGEFALLMKRAAAIEQSVGWLIPGERYELQFDFEAENADVVVSIDGDDVGGLNVTPIVDSIYQRASHRFVAAGEAINLQIRQTLDNADANLAVDNVRLRRVDSPLITEIDSNAVTHYFRQEFDFNGDPDRTDLDLSFLIDDAAVVHLNGQEVWRTNLADGNVDANTTAAFATKEPQQLEASVFNANLHSGKNVIAVELHQAQLQDIDAAFTLEAVAIEHPTDPNAELPPLAINEIRRNSAVEVSVELFNFGTSPIDLSLYELQLGDDRHSIVGDLQPGTAKTFAIAANGSTDELVSLYDPAQSAIVDAVHVTEISRARKPDGTGTWHNVETTTPNELNVVPLSDAIVINEIMYHHQPNYVDYAESNEEWIELYNRSDSVVDLTGWSLEDAVEFSFADGTQLGAGEYLVIANDPNALSQKFPNARIVGGFAGTLNNSGERIRLLDQLQNVADEVHYYDSGRWPNAADGGGASLELIDPDADNSIAESWAASNESAEWKTYTFTTTATTPRRLNVPRTAFHEAIFGLLDSGEVLLDDIRVTEVASGADRIQNGTFESDTIGESPDTWRILGNHYGTVVADPDDPTNKVLNLQATGATEHMHNHVETTFADRATIDADADYEFSFRAKWLSGSPMFNSRLHFLRGPKTTVFDTVVVNGTPGALNDNFQENAGPTFSGLRHQPVVPSPDETVTVTVAAADPDVVSQVHLHYSVDEGPFQTVAMTLNDDGLYAAEIPGQSRNDIVQFYVSAVDMQGATSQFPAEGPESRALYRVVSRDIPNDQVQSLRLIMTGDDATFLQTNTQVMSNGRLGATVIYNDEEIFYDVGVRLRASGYGRRGSLAGFNIRFDPDHKFRDVHEAIALDRGVVVSSGGGVSGRPGASPHELLIYQIAHHAGDLPGMYDDVVYIDAPRSGNTGLALLKMARYSDVYLDSQFENGSEGSLYKFELFYHSTRTVDGRPESLKFPPEAVVGNDIQDLGEDEEAYRYQFILKNNRDRDDFSPIIELGKTFSLGSSSIGEAAENVIDVEQWMRNFASTSLVGTADTYNMGLAHNLYLYERPSDGKVLAFPWDVDHGFYYDPRANILGAGTNNLRKIITLRPNRRIFYKHLLDIVQTTYNSEYLDPWIEHYTEITDQNLSDFFKDYVARRSDFVLTQIERAVPNRPFAITTNEGNDLEADSVVELQGTGWVDVHEIHVNGQKVDPEWIDDENWTVQLNVRNGVNEFALEAFDLRGRNVGSDSIRVTGTNENAPEIDYLRLTEVMYNPADPTDSERQINSTWNKDDFEFLEFANISTDTTIDLTEVQIVDGPAIPFLFDAGIVLDAGERIVVVSNQAAFRARYGDNVAIAGEYSGGLSNSGETIRVVNATGTPILSLTYSDDEPWPTQADGLGNSLEIIESSTPVGELSDAAKWAASAAIGGTPGRGSVSGDFDEDGQLTSSDIDLFCQSDIDLNGDGQRSHADLEVLIEAIFQTSFGDANLDGKFDSSDFVVVFQAAQYEDGIAGNSTWSTGDWNCDGEFDTNDFVVAFQAGAFIRG